MQTIDIIKVNGDFQIYVDGEYVGWSSSFKGQRSFWNRITKQCVMAKNFTAKNIIKNAALVLPLLEQTGTMISNQTTINTKM